ncbi:hypothetical protein GCM10027052_24300 [Parafrigoribacterium mesophilum]|uniref:hypothetical protein n=1 Tax=Parafrigoribacterium mesophilum TaxID=433646 RepID=UPI0031FC5FF0
MNGWVRAAATVLTAAATIVLVTGCTGGGPAPHPPSSPAPVTTTGELPTAATTGVPKSVTLKRYTGPMTITRSGTVLDGYAIDGVLHVRAPHVTIRNSRINGRIDTGDQNAYPGTMIQRVDIVGPYDKIDDGGYAAVGYTGFTCDGCRVRGWGKGFALVADVVIKNSWVHDIIVHGDPADGGSHNEAIISLGGNNFTIVNNRLDAGDAPNVSASLALYGQLAPISNVLVQGNLFNGGGYCVYAGDSTSHRASNTRFVDNVFGSRYGPHCGGYGPATAFEPGHGNLWKGNVFQDGSAVAAP